MDTFIQGTLRGGKQNVGASERTFGLLYKDIWLRHGLPLLPRKVNLAATKMLNH